MPKKELHPQYFPKAKIICACGAVFETGSTVPEINVEICSACHPFYTGKQKFIDTAGRLEKFKEKMEKSKKIKEKSGSKKKEENKGTNTEEKTVNKNSRDQNEKKIEIKQLKTN